MAYDCFAACGKISPLSLALHSLYIILFYFTSLFATKFSLFLVPKILSSAAPINAFLLPSCTVYKFGCFGNFVGGISPPAAQAEKPNK